MRKVILVTIASLVAAGSICAAPNSTTVPSNFKTLPLNSTSGGLSVTANLTGVAGRRIMIDSIYGTSDKSTSQFTISESSTGNVYTTKAVYNCGATSVTLGGSSNKPVFAASAPGYYYRVNLDSTTANSLIVNYHEE